MISKISEHDAAIIKGMLARGDKQQWIQAWFGGILNSGRVSEINTGEEFPDVVAAPPAELPPKGPYPSAKASHEALMALLSVKEALDRAIRELRSKDGETPAS